MSNSTLRRNDPDLLYGLEAIGAAIGLGGRQVQHLHGTGGIPTFKIGRVGDRRPWWWKCATRPRNGRRFSTAIGLSPRISASPPAT